MNWGRYGPEDHSHLKGEAKIRALLEEMATIQRSGPMRMHAQDRETNRILDEIEAEGWIAFEGTEEDRGYLLARPDEECTDRRCNGKICYCPFPVRVKR